MIDFEKMAKEIDLATDDAAAYGGGWLLVNGEGIVKRVQPPEVVAWAFQQVEKRDT